MAHPLAEEIGITAVKTVFESSFGWVFRQQSVVDWGIDAHVETIQQGALTGKLIALQIKSGPSFFEETKDGDVVFRGKPRHFDYWTNHSLPVFIILHNPKTTQIVWQKIQAAAREDREKWQLVDTHPL